MGAGLGGCASKAPETVAHADSGHPDSGNVEDSGPLDTGPLKDGALPPPGKVDVLTQHNDTLRTGANMNETVLTQANVNKASFGKLKTFPVTGLVYAQPLYVSSYPINGATHNVLVVATMHNLVYAFDADTGAALWQSQSLGVPVPSYVINTLNIQKETGILSTPVIDRAAGLIYLTNKTYDESANTQTYWIHVLDLATGKDAPGSPQIIAAETPGTGDAGPITITFNTAKQAQRPGLLLLNGTVYLGFASHEDFLPFHGWILGYQYNAAQGTLIQSQLFNTTPDGFSGGIWHGGKGLVADTNGNIYVAVSNGLINAQDGGRSYGQTFLKLSASLQVEDWYTPANWDSLDIGDWDLGSGGPLLVPNSHVLIGGGKQGIVYLIDTAAMGHLDTGNLSVQDFQATNQQWNGIYGGPVFWNNAETPTYYVWGESDVLRAFSFTNGKLSTSPVHTSLVQTPNSTSGSDPVGALAVSSNGSTAHTGILWGAIPLSDPDHATVPGQFYAYNADTLDELWDSNQNAARDSFGNWAKFVPPTIANGKVYLATHSQAVVSYGLLTDTP
jgi:hypothetical protein